MANQFDIVENLNSSTRTQYPLLIILQHDRTASIRTVIAAPLVKRSAALSGTKLHPEVSIGDQAYLVLVEQLAAIPRHLTGVRVGTAEPQRYTLITALDLLFTGV